MFLRRYLKASELDIHQISLTYVLNFIFCYFVYVYMLTKLGVALLYQHFTYLINIIYIFFSPFEWTYLVISYFLFLDIVKQDFWVFLHVFYYSFFIFAFLCGLLEFFLYLLAYFFYLPLQLLSFLLNLLLFLF